MAAWRLCGAGTTAALLSEGAAPEELLVRGEEVARRTAWRDWPAVLNSRERREEAGRLSRLGRPSHCRAEGARRHRRPGRGVAAGRYGAAT